MTRPIRRRIVVDGVERELPPPPPKVVGRRTPTPGMPVVAPRQATIDELHQAFTEDLQKVYIERDGQFLEIGVLTDLDVSFDRLDVTSFSDPEPVYMRGARNVEMRVRGTIA